jgi:uncharacterized protein YjbI with pentapeptide repeats
VGVAGGFLAGVMACALLSGVGWTIAEATSAPHVFYGCLKGGQLSSIALDRAPASCPAGALRVSWDQVGPPGVTTRSCASTYPGADLAACDLTNATLTSRNLIGANLISARLVNANLAGSFLTGANLTGAILSGVRSGSLHGVPLYLPSGWVQQMGYLIGPGANLTGANLTLVNLCGLNLDGTKLAGATLTQVLSCGTLAGTPASLPAGTHLVKGWLLGPGVGIEGLDFTNSNQGLDGLSFAGYDLHGATVTNSFFITDFTGANFANSHLSSVDFHDYTVANASFAGATMSYVTFSNLDVTGTNFSGASFDRVSGAKLTGTPIGLPAGFTLTKGWIVGPTSGLANADLSSADLSNRDLHQVYAEGTNFNNANLTNVDFTHADLNGATFAGATITGVTWAAATCPDGTNAASDGGTCEGHLG